MSHRNKLLPLSLALAACLAAPVAFAQSTTTDAQTDPQATTTTTAPPATTTQPTTAGDPQATTPATAPAKKNWSELDANGNGSLSASEAAPMDSLSKVFAKADADGNGELTQDEYKAWLAANKDKPTDKQGG